MSGTDKRAGRVGGAHDEVLLVGGAIATVATALLATNVPLRLAALVDDDAPALPKSPLDLTIKLAGGDVAWSSTATYIAIAFAIVLIAGSIGVWRAVSRARKRSKRVDRAARFMARPKDYASLLADQAAAKARDLGVDGAIGLPIARDLRGKTLYMSFEDVAIDIWGPRTGKTTARAIPAIAAAPGAVVATSNKRDVVDGTRGLREEIGEVWVFDPQEIIGEEPTWWWNPLTYVTDEVKAEALADVFISSNTDPTAKKDAYFDSAGKQLFKQLLLAAALGGKPITQIYLWLSNPLQATGAVDLLYEHNYPMLASGLEATLGFSEKQRSGLFGTALNYCSFLTNDKAMRWVTEGTGFRRPHFDPSAFAGDARQTLYLVSKEGSGSTAALVTALTMAVCEAAEQLAARSPRMRLPVPMTVVLDEAANVCRWRELPNLYSHYGSRGICIMTILQSWSQGVEVWAQNGMNKLWSAANIKVYGGGVSEVEFLRHLSDLVGDYEQTTTSRTDSSRGGGRSVQRSTRRDRIFDVADLSALDRGRVVVFSSGNAPVLAATAPWFEDGSPYRAAIEASLAKHDPGARVQVPAEPASTDNPWLTMGGKP